MELIGRTIGKYEIVSQLGRGGMGVVYKGYRADLTHYAAIKILPEHLAESPDFQQRFVREAQAIARLNHPNILLIDQGLTLIEGQRRSQRQRVGGIDAQWHLHHFYHLADDLLDQGRLIGTGHAGVDIQCGGPAATWSTAALRTMSKLPACRLREPPCARWD